MIIILLGAPGSGKEAQARKLADRFKITPILTADLLRTAINKGTELGVRARQAIDAGQPVPDEVLFTLLRERLTDASPARGFLLNGFPRSTIQAVALDELLSELGQPLDLVLYIDVDADALMERLAGRWTCESCGQVYNIYTSPPKVEGVCDKCGGQLRHRADDNEETIASRMRVFEHQTLPLVTYYRTQGKLHSVRDADDIPGVIDQFLEESGLMVELEEATPLPGPRIAPPVGRDAATTEPSAAGASGPSREKAPPAAVRRKAVKKKAGKKAAGPGKKAGVVKKVTSGKKVAKKKVAAKKTASVAVSRKASVRKTKVAKKRSAAGTSLRKKVGKKSSPARKGASVGTISRRKSGRKKR